MENQKKSNRNIFRGLRPLSFLRELLVVILGILITFGINAWVSNRSKQTTLRETMQIVVDELDKNRNYMRQEKTNMEDEYRIFRMIGADPGLESVPRDTLEKYKHLPGSYHRSILKDYAFSLLQSSNMIPEMRNTFLAAELFQCYQELDGLSWSTNNYADWKRDIIHKFVEEQPHDLGNPDAYERWRSFLDHPLMFRFITGNSPGYLIGTIEDCTRVISLTDNVIEHIGKEYGLYPQQKPTDTPPEFPLPDSSGTGSPGSGNPATP